MLLTKTDFLHFLQCDKSFWLFKNNPDEYPQKTESSYEDKLAQEGYEVQRLVQQHFCKEPDAGNYVFEKIFKSNDGLFASADIVKKYPGDKTVNIYEVKSAGKIEKNHIIDAAFQTLVVERAGYKVKEIYIAHLNKDYVRGSELLINEMIKLSLVNEQVRSMMDEISVNAHQALAFMKQEQINEKGCGCLLKSRSHHCETFNYFNKNVPKPSIYNLPRVHAKKIKEFVETERFSLDQITEDEVTTSQLAVLKSAHNNEPEIQFEKLREFFSKVKFPVYFLDYETYSSAVPIIKGMKPYAHLPIQYSLHILRDSETLSELTHYEYLAEKAEEPLNLINSLENVLGPVGTVLSWHKSFENTRNKEMSASYPEKSEFLESITERMLDLEDIFKIGYVDIAFGGSTSIKKVLPNLLPELNYDDLEVSSGTDAMVAFAKMLDTDYQKEVSQIRKEMLDYCRLDTLAMVKIFEKMRALC